MSYLIFAGNLHGGGGVQVASSYLHELSQLDLLDQPVDVVISTRVYEELCKLGSDMRCFRKVFISNYYAHQLWRRIPGSYQVCFVVFGPLYISIPAKKTIVGFAQPWIAFPENDVYRKLNFIDRIKSRSKYRIQKFLFSRYDVLVVEHELVKQALKKQGLLNQTAVVSNSFSHVFLEENSWRDCPFPSVNKNSLTFGFVGRAYLHKNLDVLTTVSDILEKKYGLIVNFIFTLSEDEMESLRFSSRSNFYTVGEINLVQCPDFYKHLDALIFPSMLECFSATPLEAMKMGVPIIASNYPFISGICESAAIYFDATNAEDIADKIHYFANNDSVVHQKVMNGQSILSELPSSRDRANKFWQLMNQ